MQHVYHLVSAKLCTQGGCNDTVENLHHINCEQQRATHPIKHTLQLLCDRKHMWSLINTRTWMFWSKSKLKPLDGFTKIDFDWSLDQTNCQTLDRGSNLICWLLLIYQEIKTSSNYKTWLSERLYQTARHVRNTICISWKNVVGSEWSPRVCRHYSGL